MFGKLKTANKLRPTNFFQTIGSIHEQKFKVPQILFTGQHFM